MRIGLDWAQIVDRHDLDVLAPTFDDGAQHQPADAAKTVDRDTNGHALFLLQTREGGLGRSFRSNTEFFVKNLIGRAGAETVHADKGARRPRITIPAERRSGLNRNLNGLRIQDTRAIDLVLFVEQFGARYRDHSCADVLPLQYLARGDGNLDFRAGGK